MREKDYKYQDNNPLLITFNALMITDSNDEQFKDNKRLRK
jgi:hypothetical protein